MADTADEGVDAEREAAARRQVARATNLAIREFAGGGAAEVTVDFVCECGCLELVALTVEAYDAGGAWLPGHRAAAAGPRATGRVGRGGWA